MNEKHVGEIHPTHLESGRIFENSGFFGNIYSSNIKIMKYLNFGYSYQCHIFHVLRRVA